MFHTGKQAEVLKPGLYIIATPIGNLRDISLRAVEILQNCDLIICEDTRVTNKLLSHYGIKKTMLTYNDYNGGKIRPRIITELKSGKIISLVSDAGTPLISDPGYKLVKEAQEQSIHITTIPGPSAAIAALTISGLPTNRFLFEGFLSTAKQARRKTLEEIKDTNTTLIFFERAERLSGTLKDIFEILGEREVSIAREITKKFEEVKREKLSVMVKYYRELSEIKGEIVIIIGPPEPKEISLEEIDKELKKNIRNMSLKDAAGIVSEKLSISRKQAYQRAIELKRDET